MAKHLVLGGLGYAGGRLTEWLVQQGSEKVYVTSRSLTPQRETWIKKFQGKVEWFPFNATTEKITLRENVDTVINLAIPSAPEASKDSVGARDAAVASALTAARFAEKNAKRLIHFSSFHIYGAGIEGTVSESTSPHPTHPYGAAHVAAEEALSTFSFSKACFVLRSCNSMGRPAHSDIGVQHGLLFFDTAKQAIQKGEIHLQTDGKGYRDFLPFSDLLTAVGALMKTTVSSSHPLLLNASSGQCMTVLDLAQLVQDEAQKLLGKKVPLKLGDKKDAFSSPFQVLHHRLTELGWNPSLDFRKEIHEILQFYSHLD